MWHPGKALFAWNIVNTQPFLPALESATLPEHSDSDSDAAPEKETASGVCEGGGGVACLLAFLLACLCCRKPFSGVTSHHLVRLRA